MFLNSLEYIKYCNFRWGIVLVKTFNGITENKSYEELYNNVAFELAIFQTAAILEIVHSAIGFVRSPVATTITQVFSRVFVVWAILYKVPSVRSVYKFLFLSYEFLVPKQYRSSDASCCLVHHRSSQIFLLRSWSPQIRPLFPYLDEIYLLHCPLSHGSFW